MISNWSFQIKKEILIYIEEFSNDFFDPWRIDELDNNLDPENNY
jgi:hypothetical protein